MPATRPPSVRTCCRPRIGQDAAATIADAREEAPDAVGGVGVAAVRLPCGGADAVRFDEREEPLHARGIQQLGGHAHGLHERHVLLEGGDQDRAGTMNRKPFRR